MSETLWAVLAGGVIGIAGSLLTLFLGQRHEIGLIRNRTRREDRDRVAARLRGLYGEVIELATLYEPREVGGQLHTMRPEDPAERQERLDAFGPRLTALKARLIIEPDERTNHTVLMALIDVVSASEMYQAAATETRADPGLHTPTELNRLRRTLSDVIGKLETACRDHVSETERAM